MIPAPASFVDFNSLAGLRAAAGRNEPEALDEAAVQFESLVIAMLMKSARQASLGDGLFDNAQTEQYLELMDQQVSLELARRGGLGFGKMITGQLGPVAQAQAAAPAAAPAGAAAAVPATPEDFVREHLPDAERAAATLGVDAELLLAQAALETGWGSAMPRYPDGSAANNLFGIKAGASWEGPRVSRWTLEHNGGFAERRREQFRAYASTADSFSDYVELIRGSERYQAALTSADQAESYARGIADSGYATDPDYADKWLAIYRGETLKSAVAELK